MEVSEESAVMSWLNSFPLRNPVTSLLDLADGIVLQQILVEISSDFTIDSLHYDTSNYVLKVTHSLTHSLTHPLTHSITHSLNYSLTHSLTHSFVNSLKYLLMQSFLLTHEGDQSQNGIGNVANLL